VPTASPAPPVGRRDDRFSPELALVCPEVRAAAIDALPDRDPDAFLVQLRASTTAPEYRLLRSVADDADAGLEAEGEPRTPLPVAIAAYLVRRTVRVAVEAAAVFAFVTGALAVVTAIRY
jgi:hypothetical protein